MPEPLNSGDPDGHGRYGMLEELPEGLVCHLCGRPFPNLGVHAYRGHGITAAQYREQHGLQRRAGLVSSGLRGRIQQNARSRMSTPAGQAFVAARDPKRHDSAARSDGVRRRWRRSVPRRRDFREGDVDGPALLTEQHLQWRRSRSRIGRAYVRRRTPETSE
jgi:hypothetical protein